MGWGGGGRSFLNHQKEHLNLCYVHNKSLKYDNMEVTLISVIFRKEVLPICHLICGNAILIISEIIGKMIAKGRIRQENNITDTLTAVFSRKVVD